MITFVTRYAPLILLLCGIVLNLTGCAGGGMGGD